MRRASRHFALMGAIAAVLLAGGPTGASLAAEKDATDPVQDLPLFMQVRELRKMAEYDRALVAARRMLAQLEADPDAKDYELLNRGRLVHDLEEIVTLPPEAQREIGHAESLVDEYGAAMDAARWADAADLAREQLETLIRYLGDHHHDVATAMYLLGLARQEQGGFAEAESLFTASRGIYYDILGPKAAAVAMSHVAHGDLAYATGDYAGAADDYREGVRIYRAYHYENVTVIARAMTKLARALRKRGRLHEAELVFTEAMSLWRLGSGSGSIATNATELAAVLLAQGEPERAEPLLREALAIRRRQLGNDHPGVARLLAQLADMLQASGRNAEALELRREALAIETASHGPDHPEVAKSLADLAASLLCAGEAAAADSLYRESITVFEAGMNGTHADVAAAYRGRGDVARTRGDLDTAAEHYRHALRVQRRAYGPYHAEITGTLTRLAGVEWLQGGPAQAVAPLRAAAESYERSRREVSSAVHRGTFQESPDLGLASALLESGRTDEAWLPMERYRGRILDDLLLAGGERPAGSSVVSAEEVARFLRRDEAMIGWLEAEPAPGQLSCWGWVLRDDGAVRWVQLEELPPPRSGASSIPAALRESLTLAGSWPFRVLEDAGTDRIARRLAEARVDPLSSELDGVERLIVVPSGALVGIPLEALPDESGRLFGERYAISYEPSATVHAWLRSGDRPAPGTASLVIGNPPFDGTLPALPASQREVDRVAGALANSRVLAGDDATEEALVALASQDGLSRFRTIHFATHALVDELRPERSALALSAVGNPDPLEAALSGERILDGRLSAWEVVRDWKLNADLVTLSGCGTALGGRVAGEGYLGFVHAFLQAGARSLVLSLWKVEDEATSLLMSRFYENLAGGASQAEALREARSWLRGQEDTAGNRIYRHPAYWAAFVLVGAPR